MPPELTKYLRAKAESKFKDGRCVIIPVGKLEDFEDLPVSVASMKPRVDLHRVAWSNTLPRRDGVISTTRVKAGEGWKQAIVEFVSEKWGPFSDLTFHCSNNGTACVDDFLFEEVKE